MTNISKQETQLLYAPKHGAHPLLLLKRQKQQLFFPGCTTQSFLLITCLSYVLRCTACLLLKIVMLYKNVLGCFTLAWAYCVARSLAWKLLYTLKCTVSLGVSAALRHRQPSRCHTPGNPVEPADRTGSTWMPSGLRFRNVGTPSHQ